MYDLDGALPSDLADVHPGTNLLVTGDTRTTHEVTLDLLAAAPHHDEGAVLVSTNESAPEVVAGFESRDALDPDRIGIVDCTTGEEDQQPLEVPVGYLSSPGDLTGISLEFAKLVDQIQPTGLRVGLSTISTVLMYAEVETTFRFLHVFCSRIRSGGWLGVFTLDPDMHTRETTNTIRALFDGEVAIDDDGVEVRGI